MRKLASIQKIAALDSIEGKDRIELATILGWHVIVKKNEFAVGDSCVYVEIDSILPQKPEFEFLRKSCFSSKWNGFRIRTMKMGNVYSQGIAFPVSILTNKKWKIGDDVTEELKIIKYDPDEVETTQVAHKKNWLVVLAIKLGIIKFDKKTQKFPDYIHKTDETRLQAIPEILDELRGKEVYITEKIDGTSTTYIIHKGKFIVCSRNNRVFLGQKNKYTKDVYWQIAIAERVENKLKAWAKKHRRSIAIQGEIIGENVQKNKYNIRGNKFKVFQIYDIDKRKFVDFTEMLNIAAELEFSTVPVLYVGVIPEKSVDEWVSFSNGISTENQNIIREGIVVRTTTEMTISGMQTILNRASFKVVSPEFLIANGI